MLSNESMEKISNLTADEIIVAVELSEVAKEAKEIFELIRSTYKCFGIGQDIIEVWRDRDGYNHEYLTHDGIWQARYLHQTYDIRCSPDCIYEYFRAEYLVENGFVPEYEGNQPTEAGEKKLICRYFRSFIEKTRELNLNPEIILPIIS